MLDQEIVLHFDDGKKELIGWFELLDISFIKSLTGKKQMLLMLGPPAWRKDRVGAGDQLDALIFGDEERAGA